MRYPEYDKGPPFIPMPDWIIPRPGWRFAGWFPREPAYSTFEELLKNAQHSDHGELREVDVYPEGAAEWFKERKDIPDAD